MTKSELISQVKEAIELERKMLDQMEASMIRSLEKLRARAKKYEDAVIVHVDPNRANPDFLCVMASMIDGQMNAISCQRELIKRLSKIETA